MTSSPAGRDCRAVLQTAIAAALAWWIATLLLHHDTPTSAPIVAALSIGAATTTRARRTLEIVAGVSVGIGLGSALIAAAGRGPLTLGLLVFIAMSIATAARAGQLVVLQSAMTAILVFGAGAITTTAAVDRLIDALIGGTVAALVSILVFPPDPDRLLDTAIGPVLDDLASALATLSIAFRSGDLDLMSTTLDRARAIEPHIQRLSAAIPTALEVARLVPARRRRRHAVERRSAAAAHLDHAVRHLRVLARSALHSQPEEAERHDLAQALDKLGLMIRSGVPAHPANPIQDNTDGQATQLRVESGVLPPGDDQGTADPLHVITRGLTSDLVLAFEPRR